LTMFFVEFRSNLGSESPNRRILAKNAGSATVECKDVIENEMKRKKMDMLYAGMAALIKLLTARALHFVDIHNSDLNTTA
jgi:hypothetical protein